MLDELMRKYKQQHSGRFCVLINEHTGYFSALTKTKKDRGLSPVFLN